MHARHIVTAAGHPFGELGRAHRGENRPTHRTKLTPRRCRHCKPGVAKPPGLGGTQWRAMSAQSEEEKNMAYFGFHRASSNLWFCAGFRSNGGILGFTSSTAFFPESLRRNVKNLVAHRSESVRGLPQSKSCAIFERSEVRGPFRRQLTLSSMRLTGVAEGQLLAGTKPLELGIEGLPAGVRLRRLVLLREMDNFIPRSHLLR